MANQLLLFSGNAHRRLAEDIAAYLNLPLGDAEVSHFSNGETNVKINENVRDCDVFIIQPTCNPRVNDYIMELLIMADAMRRSSAKRITAVMPLFGYARQDKKDKSRAPISAKLIANLIEKTGIDRVITVDLHASQIQGFFDIPVDNLYAEHLLATYARGVLDESTTGTPFVVVSPDVGGVKRAKSMAEQLGVGLAIIHKERVRANEVAKMTLVGDVEGHHCLLVDDMADTCGTLTTACETLKTSGAKDIYAICTHGVLSGPAIERLNSCTAMKALFVTSSCPVDAKTKACPKLQRIDIAPLLGEAIRRTHNGESISVLFRSFEPGSYVSPSKKRLITPPKSPTTTP